MKKHGIPINDLHAVSASMPAELFQGPGDVHYTPEGSKKLGALVTAKIRLALKESAQTRQKN